MLFSAALEAKIDYLNALENYNGEVDFSLLMNDSFTEGKYKINVYINNIKKDEQDIVFKNKKNKLIANITPSDLKKWGINTDYYKELKILNHNDLISDKILKELFKFQTDLHLQKVYLSVPSIALIKSLTVDKSMWDEGITAGFIKYNYNGSYLKIKGPVDTGEHIHTLSLNNGFNINAWRYRQSLNYNNIERKFSLNQQYTYRTLSEIDSLLTIGDFVTTSPELNSYKLKGIALNSDFSMSTSSGYAPIINEFANSFAEVTLQQNDIILYQTTVPPGPFTLTDLPPLLTNGEIDLLIKEESGQVRKIKLWNFYATELLRPKQWNYHFASGLANRSEKRKDIFMTQASIAYGINNYLTATSGIEFTSQESTLHLGSIIGLGKLGSLSLKGYWIENRQKKLTIYYLTQLAKTNTSLALGSSLFKYNNKQLRLSDDKQKYNISINLTQPFYNIATLNTGYTKTEYFWKNKSSDNISIGLSSFYKALSYSLEYEHSKESKKIVDNKFLINFSYPLNQDNHDWLNIRSIYDKEKKSLYNNINVNGSALGSQRFNYNINLAKNGQSTIQTSVNTNYRSRIAVMKLNTQFSNEKYRIGYGLQGGIIIHNGISLTQDINENFGIIDFNGGKKIKAVGHPTIESDNRGYLILPYLVPYKKNTISIDANSVNEKYDIDNYSYHLTPTKGAIIAHKVNVKQGEKAIFSITNKLPFGARAYIDNGHSVPTEFFYITEDNQLYITNLEKTGKVIVKWGNSVNKQCSFNYHLKQNELQHGVYFSIAHCAQENK